MAEPIIKWRCHVGAAYFGLVPTVRVGQVRVSKISAKKATVERSWATDMCAVTDASSLADSREAAIALARPRIDEALASVEEKLALVREVLDGKRDET